MAADLRALKEDALGYHPAAAYHNISPKHIEVSAYRESLPHIATYLSETGKLRSLMKAPTMIEALAVGSMRDRDMGRIQRSYSHMIE